MPLAMLGSKPYRVGVLCAAVLFAATVATARADDLPGTFVGHGVSFSYPTSWQHVPGQFRVQAGTPLWSEFFAPTRPVEPAPAPDPNQPAPGPQPGANELNDVIAISAYRLPISITKKNLGRYKQAIQSTVMQLTAQGGGQMTTAGARVNMGGLPGYKFEISLPSPSGATLDSRIVMVFRKKIEFFLNCQSTRDGALAAEVTGGCDQVMQSFRLGG